MAGYEEYIRALAEAIYREDLVLDECALAEMAMIGVFREPIMRAKRTVRPLPAAPDVAPFVVPIPGHKVGSTLGIPRLEEKVRA